MDEFQRILSWLLVFIGLNSGILGAWQDGQPINSHLSAEVLNGRIRGKFENFPEDHLSLLLWNEDHLLIGARDALFNVTTDHLSIISVLNWTVSTDHKEMCQLKGQKDTDCHNFIRLIHGPIPYETKVKRSSIEGANGTEEVDENRTITTDEWIVCGTNAFKPRCRLYSPNLKTYREEISGIGYSPFDPTHMATSLFHHESVYAATVADFGGTDSLIYKNPMRTEQHDSRHLSSPSFVSSMSYGELALFFFRELAVEHTNCGKVVYSRIGRICGRDGGSRKHKDRFTTFLKARLNCSVPGEFPFYFDHIQATTPIVTDTGRSLEILYAVFTTPDNSIGASAVCTFSLPDIIKVFDGQFKGQSSFESNWLPVPSSEVPSPRPGACPTDSSPVPEGESVTFNKEHPLMDETVQGSLTFIHTSNTDRFTVIEVDPGGEDYHILYVGTESGKVLKVVVDINLNSSRYRRHPNDEVSDIRRDHDDDRSDPLAFNLNSSLISASWQVSDRAIKTLRLVNSKTLLIGTDTSLVLLPTTHCEEYTTCHACALLQDPHCFWDMNGGKCRVIESEESVVGLDLRQNLWSRDTSFCPEENSTLAHYDELLSEEPVQEIPAETTPVPECCACTAGFIPFTPFDLGNNRIPELDGHFRYAPTQSIEETNRIETFQKIPLPKREFESSSVKSGESISRGSIAMATVGSAFIALLIGFCVGFLGSRWLSNRKNLSKTGAAANVQFGGNLSEQSQRLTPSKPIDFVVNKVNNWTGPPKNNSTPKSNITTDTLEKTVKKIYI